ncbi:MAG: glycoside hydrolase family 65 protein [Candidatus Omnitrophica bacterium]|nr:glycoside hydrolase family 65 protein [Candidatus Omnitrophota bacterium]
MNNKEEVKKIINKHSNGQEISAWALVYEHFVPAEESLREALCTLANGYFGTRGAIPESVTSKIHYPGTYVAGLYNRLATHISGKRIINEDLVNCPNWVFLTFKVGDGDWFQPDSARILSFRQKLDMKKGLLNRKIRFQNRKGQRTMVEINRIVHMADPHCAAQEYIITPENYNEFITVRTMLDGTVLNTGVERYRQLNSKHWKPYALGSFGRGGIYLSMKTGQSRIQIAEAAKIGLFSADRKVNLSIKHLMKGKERIGQEFKFFARSGRTYSIEKTVFIYTSKDEGIKDPIKHAVGPAEKVQRFKNLLKSHQQAWEDLWDKFDIKIEGHMFSQRILRLHIFHLLQTASPNNIKIDAGLPARGLHGEAYRGHIFWDSIFTMPFYDLHYPEISKALHLYRYRRLAKARECAKKEGYRGAMFPWQSGSTGKEETQIIHLNPLSGQWGPDLSRRQRHVSFAIAYNIWQHWRRAGDLGFLIRYGAEIILSVARFWASLVKYDHSDKKYHTYGVMGPDEFHEKLPRSNRQGLKDNAYTNMMIVWTLLKAQEVIKLLPEGHKARLMKKIKLEQKEFSRWDDIIHKMNLIIDEKGIISQFDGYFNLKELDWKGYRQEYGNIQRMDRILKAEGKSPDEYKVSKQADALMIFYLLSFPEIEDIFLRLGCRFDKDILRKNYDFYVKRTSHGSTLSKVTHCYFALLLSKPKEGWKRFIDVLESDIYDVQGGTTPEGIHIGVMGGSVDIVMRGFAGLRLHPDKISIEPKLPQKWRSLKFKFLYKSIWISMTISRSQAQILLQGPVTIPVEVNGKLHYPPLGKTFKVPLKRR